MKKSVIYARVSKNDGTQTPENQLVPLRNQAKAFGWDLVGEYVDQASGSKSDRDELLRMFSDADKKQFDVLQIWSLDRLSREGISNTLGYIERLNKNGIAIKSMQESWLDTSDEGVGKLILSIFAWVAGEERKRIVERTKAGLERARAQGKTLGRPKGVKDRYERRKNGYNLRWSKEPKTQKKYKA